MYALLVYSAATGDNIPYLFPTCELVDQQRVRRGSRKSIWQLEFHALPWTDKNFWSDGAIRDATVSIGPVGNFVTGAAADGGTSGLLTTGNILYFNVFKTSQIP
jgi:hypothetical protein